MRTSLRGIADKAKRQKRYRFLNLHTMLNKEYLLDSWRYLNKNSASGVDKISAREYEENLESNIEGLVDRLKRKSYRAKLVRRQYIPKGNGKMRPLGIPAIEDKLLQMAVFRILQAIYEQEFLAYSYGYRIGRGAKDAVKQLQYELQFGFYGYVVEADIKGFFDTIDHEWLMRMLALRINDKAFLGLIRKWLKAGILDTNDMVIHPLTGTPQGGIISPILANIYLHYVLDLWFEKVVKSRCTGQLYLCRYADDFVCVFQYKRDAERFYRTLPKRLGKFGLTLSLEKTQVLNFSKFRRQEKTGFDFLGFEFRWGLSRRGKPIVKRRTSRAKFRKSLSNFTAWCKENRNKRLSKFFGELNAKLRGYYNYYGVIGNYQSLREFFHHVVRILFKWLNRRSQRRSYNWQGFGQMLDRYNLARPRITEKTTYQLSFLQAFC